MPGLTYHIENQVATIVLNNRPQNRIGDQMTDELAGAIDVIGGSDARALLEAVVMRTNSPFFTCPSSIQAGHGPTTRLK